MKKLFILLMVLGLFAGGCAQLAATGAPTDIPALAVAPNIQPESAEAATTAPTSEPPALPAAEGVCSNPYYPVVDGATWTYDMEGSTVVYTMSVEDEGEFKIAVVGPDSTAVLEGRCTEEGITILERGMGGSFYTEDGSSSTDSLSQTGVTLPNDLQVGDEWSQQTSISAESGDSEVTITAEIVTNYVVQGKETVTVPAGTFEALKIEQRGSMVMNGQEIQTLGYQWLAEGIGTVKSESGMATGSLYNIQLVSYNIP